MSNTGLLREIIFTSLHSPTLDCLWPGYISDCVHIGLVVPHNVNRQTSLAEEPVKEQPVQLEL